MSWRFWKNWIGRDWTEFILTSLIGLFTLVNAVAMVIYVSTFYKSIIETGRQTDKLICVANIQAGAVSQMAAEAKIQAYRTKDLADRALDQARATNDLARQTKRVADTAARGLTEAHNNFMQDQRPWIWVKTTGEFHVKVGDYPTLNIRFINYGKTPAVARSVAFVEAEINPTPARIKMIREGRTLSDETIIAPNEESSIYTTAYTPVYLDQMQYDMIMSNQARLISGGRIVYKDLSGKSYESWFCFERLSTGAVSFCAAPELNGMK
jgi:hypothetical protein